jgi:hypothetical protein
MAGNRAWEMPRTLRHAVQYGRAEVYDDHQDAVRRDGQVSPTGAIAVNRREVFPARWGRRATLWAPDQFQQWNLQGQ